MPCMKQARLLDSVLHPNSSSPVCSNTFLIIGGHGFWDKGGVDTGGCPQKNFPAAFGGRKIFSPAPPPGGEKFFSVGCLFSRPGGDFA